MIYYETTIQINVSFKLLNLFIFKVKVDKNKDFTKIIVFAISTNCFFSKNIILINL